MNAPMPPSIRLEQQVLTKCQVFYSANETDANTPEGMRYRAAIWALTGCKPTLQSFEDALEALHERNRIESNTLGLWDGEREVWPRDPYYAAAKTEHLDVQDGLILAAVRNLIPKVAGQ